MSSLRKRDEFKFPILSKEMILRDEEAQKPSEVKVYYLSPEELENYRKGVNDDMSIMKKLEEKYPDLESLVKSMQGKTIKEWEAEHGMQNSYFYYLKKKYIERGDKVPEQKPTKGTLTPPQEEAAQEAASEEKQETAAGSGAIIRNNETGQVLEFPSIPAALQYIENNCSKKEAQQIALYRKVPFSFGVNVVPGEVS